MPQLGESVVEGRISKWPKRVGDEVKISTKATRCRPGR